MSALRRSYSLQLETLQHHVLEMGGMAEQLIKDSVKALIERDSKLAQKTIEADEEIDQKELDIESKCMQLLALQQPMATDLRMISGALKIITDIERLADHTTKIAKKALVLSELPEIKPYVDLPEMATRVIKMFKLSLDAFVTVNPDLALEVIDLDDEIDEYNHRIFRELLEIMVKDSSTINSVTHLIVVVQSLERIADHVTNICERIVYVATGKLPEVS